MLKLFYLNQIFALDSAVVKTQNIVRSHNGFLTSVMHNQGEHTNQINAFYLYQIFALDSVVVKTQNMV